MNKYELCVRSVLRWLSALSKLKRCVRPAVNPRTICLYHTFANLRKKDILNEIRNKISIGALCLVFYLLLANTTTENTALLICVHSHTLLRDEDYYYWADRTEQSTYHSLILLSISPTNEVWFSVLVEMVSSLVVLHESISIEERQKFEPQLWEKLSAVVGCGVSTASYVYCSCIVYWY